MTEGPCVAAIAYLGEQVPDFGNAFGQSRASKAPKYVGVQGFDAIVLRSGKSMRRTPSATKTELAGDLPDGTATFKKSPDLIE